MYDFSSIKLLYFILMFCYINKFVLLLIITFVLLTFVLNAVGIGFGFYFEPIYWYFSP